MHRDRRQAAALRPVIEVLCYRCDIDAEAAGATKRPPPKEL
jgi:hypothetical protein